jgi:hypothetical protein
MSQGSMIKINISGMCPEEPIKGKDTDKRTSKKEQKGLSEIDEILKDFCSFFEVLLSVTFPLIGSSGHIPLMLIFIILPWLIVFCV